LPAEDQQRALAPLTVDALAVLPHKLNGVTLCDLAPRLFVERLNAIVEVLIRSLVAAHAILQSTMPAAVSNQTNHGMTNPPGLRKTTRLIVIHHKAALNGSMTQAGGPQISQISSADSQPGAMTGISMMSGKKRIQTGTAMAAMISMKPPGLSLSKYKSLWQLAWRLRKRILEWSAWHLSVVRSFLPSENAVAAEAAAVNCI
jgi:hypothetical protein